MDREKAVKKLEDTFSGRILESYRKSDTRLYVTISPDDVIDFVKFVFNELGARFNIATAVDVINGIEILYHFQLDRAGIIITLRTTVDKDKCEIESITPVMEGAEWIEREIHELFGVNFRNHPNMKPLLLADDWPKGEYPLRKDFRSDL